MMDKRKKYITQLELMAAPLLLASCPKLLRGRQALWFIDNQGAIGALIRATSRSGDCAALAMAAQCALHALHVEHWCELFDSNANPGDPFSRYGLWEAFVREQRSLSFIQPVKEADYIWQSIFDRRWKSIWAFPRERARADW